MGHRLCLWVGGAGQERVPGPGVLGAGRGTVGETEEMESGGRQLCCASDREMLARSPEEPFTWALTSLFEPLVLDLVPLID